MLESERVCNGVFGNKADLTGTIGLNRDKVQEGTNAREDNLESMGESVLEGQRGNIPSSTIDHPLALAHAGCRYARGP